jgi:hypothetical protein
MLSFASAVGNLFNRLGKIGAWIENMDAYQSTQETALIDVVSGAVAQFDAESDLQAVIGANYISILNNAGSIGQTAQVLAAQTVNRMIFRDNPQLNQTLQNGNTLTSIQEVIRQMKVQGATVLAQTIVATPTTFTGSGNGTIVTSVKRPLDGLTLENAYEEDMLLLCISDSLLGNATEGNELFRWTGVGATGAFNFDWPLGSNANRQLSAINGNADNSQGNLLTNSGYEDWDSNVPDNFEIVAGTPGAQIFQETSVVYDPTDGGSALRLLGDGSTLIEWQQEFDNSDGTSGRLAALTQYAVNLFLRRDAVAAAAGVLQVDLIDENGTIIQDENGVNNSFTIDLTALTVFYAAYNGTFRTPLVLPSQMFLHFKVTTAITSSRSIYIDKMAMGVMTQSYASGPYAAVFSGSEAFRQGDYANIAVTNSRGAAGTLSTFQTLWARLFPQMIANELLLPSSSVPSISDNLIG